MFKNKIRHEGDLAENRFFELVPNSRRPILSKIGDAEVEVGGEWFPVEIKQSSSGTVNQVRAVKYIPLVVYTGKCWYVIPPNEIVEIVSKKSRGQHTEIPFESANISTKKLSNNRKCGDSELYVHVLEAIFEGFQHEDTRNAMTGLLNVLSVLSKAVKKIISGS